MWLQTVLLFVAYFTTSVVAAFGWTSSNGNYVIDVGSNNNALVFSVSQSTCDINSIRYRGHELQYSGKGSHIASGLGSSTSVSITTINSMLIDANFRRFLLFFFFFRLLTSSSRRVYQNNMHYIDSHALFSSAFWREHHSCMYPIIENFEIAFCQK